VAKAASPKVITKKVSPYPFEASLDQGGVKKPIEIIFLTAAGFLSRADKLLVHVGEHYQVFFELPVLKQSILTAVRVLKTYDKAVDPRALKVERMIEFHFEKLGDEHKSHIFAFIAAIGQNK
jgi:hypothetical protein